MPSVVLGGEEFRMSKADFPSESAFAAVASRLQIDVRSIKAFAKVESGPHGAFIQSLPGEPPVILYERHKFHQFTDGRYDQATVTINGQIYYLSSVNDGGYGPASIQHEKLAAAVKLDRNAALRSCSYGLFQLMGFNYGVCGFGSLQSFINAMWESVDRHLDAFVQFVVNNRKTIDGKSLIQALRESPPDFKTAALIYNGPKQAQYGYATKFRKAFES
jgi:hypothetical protein